MPDTEENQARYPQPDSQADGVGFPLARVVVVICVATGRGSPTFAAVGAWALETMSLRGPSPPAPSG